MTKPDGGGAESKGFAEFEMWWEARETKGAFCSYEHTKAAWESAWSACETAMRGGEGQERECTPFAEDDYCQALEKRIRQDTIEECAKVAMAFKTDYLATSCGIAAHIRALPAAAPVLKRDQLDTQRTDEFRRGIAFAKAALKQAVLERGDLGHYFIDEYIGGSDEIPVSEVRRDSRGDSSEPHEGMSVATAATPTEPPKEPR